MVKRYDAMGGAAGGREEPRRERPKVLDRPVRLTGTPVLEGICFQVVDVPAERPGGLLMPEGSEDKFQSPVGLVLAVGPDVKTARPGDKFLIANRPGACLQHPVYTEDYEVYMGTESQVAVILDAPVCPACGRRAYPTGVTFDHSACPTTGKAAG